MSKKYDKWLLITVIIIAIFGIVMIYSASSIWAEYKFNDSFKFVKAQSAFFIISLVIVFVLKKINPKTYYEKANLILLICFLLLALVLIPGLGKIRNGSRSWFGIGGFGIQPSEFAKIGLIIYVSKYLANNQKQIFNIKKGVLPILLVIGVFFLLIMLEPDFGTAMVIILTLTSILFISGVKLSFFVKIGIVGILGIIGLIAVAPYRMLRIVSFLNPWVDPLGSGYQIIQSLYAEEFGFLGILIVTTFFGFIFYRIVKISLNCDNLFYKYLSFGLGFGIIIQALLNICVVIGLIPVTGVTLPFFSYGGSSLLVSMISIGIILSISKE